MKQKDWVPSREQDLVDLCHQWVLILGRAPNVARWDWDAQECVLIVGKLNDFFAVREAYQITKGRLNLLDKNEKKKIAVAAMRDFANTSIRFNKKMADSDKLALGIRPQDTVKTKHPAPTVQPNTLAENTVNHFEHKIVAVNPVTQTQEKPDGVHGVRYACIVGGERPADASELRDDTFTQWAHYIFAHKEADKGKTAYYATCYENAKGNKGPWSEIVEAVIG